MIRSKVDSKEVCGWGECVQVDVVNLSSVI